MGMDEFGCLHKINKFSVFPRCLFIGSNYIYYCSHRSTVWHWQSLESGESSSIGMPIGGAGIATVTFSFCSRMLTGFFLRSHSSRQSSPAFVRIRIVLDCMQFAHCVRWCGAVRKWKGTLTRPHGNCVPSNNLLMGTCAARLWLSSRLAAAFRCAPNRHLQRKGYQHSRFTRRQWSGALHSCIEAPPPPHSHTHAPALLICMRAAFYAESIVFCWIFPCATYFRTSRYHIIVKLGAGEHG